MNAVVSPGVPPVTTDIFISYAREDRPTAQRLADALQAQGLDVWWDRDIPGGQDFADVIAEQIDHCRAALVLWSEHAVRSSFVRDESARTRDAGKLVPVRIAEVALPLGFGTLHTLDLLDWDGDVRAPAFVDLLQALRARLPAGDAAGAADTAGPGGSPLRDSPSYRRRLWLQRAAAVAALGAVGGGSVLAWRDWSTGRRHERAVDLVRQGIANLDGSEKRLQIAQELLFAATQEDPAFGRAHYHLAQVYVLQSAQTGDASQADSLRQAARDSLQAALAHVADLDRVQADQTRRQLAALGADAEAPVERVARAEPTDSTAARPADKTTNRPDGHSAAASPRPESARPAPGRTPAATGPTATDRPASASAPAPARAPAAATAPPPPSPPVASAPTDTGTAAAAGAEGDGPGRLMGLPPSNDRVQQLRTRLEPAFGPDAATRVATVTALLLEPGTLADTLPLAVERALQAQSGAPDSPATKAGVINTLVLLQAGSPVTLDQNRTAIEQLLAAAAANGPTTSEHIGKVRTLLAAARGARPVVYVQYADAAQADRVQALRERLTRLGYLVPAAERVDPARAPDRSAVRAQGFSNLRLARGCARLLSTATRETVSVTTLRNARPRVDTYELWLAPGGAAAGRGTSG